ncbi:hypothetical protein BDQ12DRAFT_728504 [Crucibulum laeve]|uniref:Uncharacterized protein n=1 Tax=Crucibulum laeve TaxID=68775 RepID=A0A5C3LHL3_9AGAR|nr:hypothetical protein BDQ12DRAFT_728504 [Crucibulum laeve]
MDKPAILLSDSLRMTCDELAFEAVGSPLPLEDIRKTPHLRKQNSFEFRCNFSLPDIAEEHMMDFTSEENFTDAGSGTSVCTTLVGTNDDADTRGCCDSGCSQLIRHNVDMLMRKFRRFRHRLFATQLNS